MPETAKAVFLSYASQDVAAAQRISTALRAAGVEVWLDQDGGLVGGDAWDRKIREQINACALFMPIISANTQARHEGYFRLEWKLAGQRTHMMSGVRAFLLPVVIDETRDAEAHVPEEFRAVQWTRLAGGQPTPPFIARVNTLLAPSTMDSAMGGASRPDSAVRTDSSGHKAPPTAGRRRRWLTPAILGTAALAALAFWQPWKSRAPASASPPATQSPADASAVGSAKADKSIAVLPFANRSPDKENEFFTDGVHEDILTNLFNIRALRVVSRTSVEQYRDTKKSLKEIGAELGVAYILEGSVQRVGHKVRVTGQLIDARTDTHLWAKAFDKDLSDVFAIQAEIAKAIAAELRTVLSPQEQKLIEQRPTENIAAYDLYLKARTLTRRSRREAEAQERMLQAAVELDPKFAAAWSKLASSYVGFNATQAQFDAADAALARAVELAPDAPDTLTAQGWFALRRQRDYTRSIAHFEKAIQLQPSNAAAVNGLATVQRTQGRWLESVTNFRRALQLDPAGKEFAIDLTLFLEAGRRWDEARTVREHLVDLASRESEDNLVTTRGYLTKNVFSATGSLQRFDEWLASLTPAQLEVPQTALLRAWRANVRGDYAEWQRMDALRSTLAGPDSSENNKKALENALIIAAHGDQAGARLRLENRPAEARASLERNPANAMLWGQLAVMEALFGQTTEALRDAQKAVELSASHASEGPRQRWSLAVVQAWTGDKDRALAELTELLRVPYGYEGSVHDLRVDAAFAPLRGDPRFEALLKDPKNIAPLF